MQPAAGDAGTALGAALHVAAELGDRTAPMTGVDLGRGWSTRSWRRNCAGRRCRTPGPSRSPPRRRRCSPATASSPGTRGAASTARARSATGRCSPTRATGTPPAG
nr:hypothetical protein [Micromonospora provocatoris]